MKNGEPHRANKNDFSFSKWALGVHLSRARDFQTRFELICVRLLFHNSYSPGFVLPKVYKSESFLVLRTRNRQTNRKSLTYRLTSRTLQRSRTLPFSKWQNSIAISINLKARMTAISIKFDSARKIADFYKLLSRKRDRTCI